MGTPTVLVALSVKKFLKIRANFGFIRKWHACGLFERADVHECTDHFPQSHDDGACLVLENNNIN